MKLLFNKKRFTFQCEPSQLKFRLVEYRISDEKIDYREASNFDPLDKVGRGPHHDHQWKYTTLRKPKIDPSKSPNGSPLFSKS